MQSISICMVVKNEADVLSEALESAKQIGDEIIIVDIESTDRTKEVAKKYTDQVYDFKWNEDFSAARNTAFSYATKDYILFIDAEEYVPEEERDKLLKLKEGLDSDVDAVSMFTVISWDEYGNPILTCKQHRLVKRSKDFKWYGAVHEYLEASGNILDSDISIYQRRSNESRKERKRNRNIAIYKKSLEKGEKFSPKDIFNFANDLKDDGSYPLAIDQYNKYLESEGELEDKIRACIHLADCYKNQGNLEKEVEALTQSIKYDIPRPEVSCRIGDMYKMKKMFNKAIIWYSLAIGVDFKNSLALQNNQYATWYPHVQCTECYWQLGNKELAFKHHEKAKKYRPKDERILYNEQFFKGS